MVEFVHVYCGIMLDTARGTGRSGARVELESLTKAFSVFQVIDMNGHSLKFDVKIAGLEIFQMYQVGGER